MNKKQREALTTYNKLNKLEEEIKQLKIKLTDQLESLGSRYDGIVCGVSVDLDDNVIYLDAEDYYDCFENGERCKEVDIEEYIENIQN